MDMNDRQLRFIVDGLGGKANGTPREDGFDITVASEVMAVFCLASSLHDLKERLARIVCAYTYDGQPVTAGQIGAAGAMAALLKDAIDPQPGPDPRAQPRHHPRRAFCQHRPRLQQRHGHPAQPLPGRLCGH